MNDSFTDTDPSESRPLGPWIDAHCHLADPRYSPTQLSALLARSRQAGITRWIQGGVHPHDWSLQRQLATQFPEQILPCFGLHPVWVATQSTESVRQGLQDLRKIANESTAIGEIGLDFRPDMAAHSLQLEAFEAQLKLACEIEKPIVLHIVKAHEEALALLQKIGVPRPGGLAHGFSSGPGIAKRYLALGLTLSISGAVTRKGFESLKKTVVSVPANAFVLETDSPDQGPQREWQESSQTSADSRSAPDLAGLNEPSYLLEVARTIAGLRGENAWEILDRSTKQLIQIFGLKA